MLCAAPMIADEVPGDRNPDLSRGFNESPFQFFIRMGLVGRVHHAESNPFDLALVDRPDPAAYSEHAINTVSSVMRTAGRHKPWSPAQETRSCLRWCRPAT